jgi:hypothetical protein
MQRADMGRLCLGGETAAGIEADQAYDDRKSSSKHHLRSSVPRKPARGSPRGRQDLYPRTPPEATKTRKERHSPASTAFSPRPEDRDVAHIHAHCHPEGALATEGTRDQELPASPRSLLSLPLQSG